MHRTGDAGRRAVDDDGACDREHFGGHARHEALGFKLDGGRDNGVCKARDWDDGACARGFCDIVIPAEAGQHGAKKDQRDGRGRACRVLI